MTSFYRNGRVSISETGAWQRSGIHLNNGTRTNNSNTCCKKPTLQKKTPVLFIQELNLCDRLTG